MTMTGNRWDGNSGVFLAWRSVRHLLEAVTDILGEVELTGLVDEVKAPLPDLALVQDVDGVGRAGHCQASNSQEASQDLPRIQFQSIETL